MKRGLKLSLKTTKPSIEEGLKCIGATGFEPMTPTTPKWYATKLRYAPSNIFSCVLIKSVISA